MKNNHYVHFLNLLKAIEAKDNHPAIDETSKQVLNEIALGVANDLPLTVSDVMSLKHIGSPATLHRKLNQLIAAHLVQAAFEGSNRRTKYMNLTSQGTAYFRRLAQAMHTAVQG
jgi:Leucine-rich repeat (LRR) protein